MPDRQAKKLAFLPAVRCTQEFRDLVQSAANREKRALGDLQRIVWTEWLVAHHPDMVEVDADAVTDFGALPCDTRSGSR
jgi:hypothetical protein